MKILALDIATKCGLAFGEAASKPRAWSVDLGKGGSEDARFAKLLRMVAHYIKTLEPDVVAIEQPIGGRDANAYLIGLVACARGEAARHGKKVVCYFPSTVRKHFLGKALTSRDFPGLKQAAAKRAIKGAVMARCHLLGWKVEGPDEGDAAALWDYACAIESRAHQITSIGGLFKP